MTADVLGVKARAVELRNHPLMRYRGVPNWPPVWTRGHMTEIKTVRGEIGILKHLLVHEQLPARCFLIMEHEGALYGLSPL